MNNDSNLLFYSTKCNTCNVFMKIAHSNNILKYFKLICIDGQEKNFQEKGLRKVPTIVIKNMGKPIDGNDCLTWLESSIKLRTGKVYDNTNEQYLPEVGIPNQNMKMNQNIPVNSGNSGNSGSSSNSNQFEVPKTNILKRGNLNATPPPLPTSNINTRSSNPLNPQNQLTQLQSQMQQLQQMQNQLQNQMKNKSNTANTQSGTPGVSVPSVKPVQQLFGFMENEMAGCSDTYAYLLVDNPLPKSFLPPDKDLQIYTAPEGNKLDKKTQEMYLKNMEIFRENEKNDTKRKIEEEHRNVLTNK
jgi:hypothetical protein